MTTAKIGRFDGCLLGCAVGDALGMPVEMMTPEEILSATNNDGVRGYLSPIQRRIRGTRNLRPGWTTDDTQLTLAVARSLARCAGFDVNDQARELVCERNATTFGWGKTTDAGAAEIERWFASRGKEGRHPDLPAPPPPKPGANCGNGVAMKVAPLGLFHGTVHGVAVEPLLSDVMALGLMTHGDPRASIAAFSVACVIVIALQKRIEPSAGKDVLRRIAECARFAEDRYRFFRRSEDAFSARLIRAESCMEFPVNLRLEVGTKCFALESVAFAIATFCRHPADFRAGVLEAVNAGGDADSTGSMVGAMIGANLGIAGIPTDLADGVLGAKEILRTAHALEIAAATGRPSLFT